MRTERQKQAARANGAKSRGPVTSEGKLASSRNATTHGILSGTIVLQGESEERFNALLADLHADLQPQTTVETTLVENMAVARWRQMRIWGIEKANMEHRMRAQAEEPGVSEDNPAGEEAAEDSATRCALAFRTLSDDSRSLDLINRYESRYDRQYLRAHRRFLELVDRRTPPPDKPPVHVQPAASLPQAGNAVSAKQTRQPIKFMPSHGLAAVACAMILCAFSFIPSSVSGHGSANPSESAPTLLRRGCEGAVSSVCQHPLVRRPSQETHNVYSPGRRYREPASVSGVGSGASW